MIRRSGFICTLLISGLIDYTSGDICEKFCFTIFKWSVIAFICMLYHSVDFLWYSWYFYQRSKINK